MKIRKELTSVERLRAKPESHPLLKLIYQNPKARGDLEPFLTCQESQGKSQVPTTGEILKALKTAIQAQRRRKGEFS